MSIDDLHKVNKICLHMQKTEGMDYRTAYSFALAVVNNKDYIADVLNGEEGDDE